ncbi:MAG: hypothetical protein Q7T62_06410 [Undibacterium sp.]|nr:hypothetical protein [Undibacterium sp.]
MKVVAINLVQVDEDFFQKIIFLIKPERKFLDLTIIKAGRGIKTTTELSA